MDSLIRHSWHCPVPSCDNPELWSYSEDGLETRINFHNAKHTAERNRAIIKFDQAEKIQPPKDYNILHLTWLDVTFLLSRGVAMDENTVWEGYCGHQSTNKR